MSCIFTLSLCFILIYSASNFRFDVASLVPLKSPVLSLQHAVVPLDPPHEGSAIDINTSLSVDFLSIRFLLC